MVRRRKEILTKSLKSWKKKKICTCNEVWEQEIITAIQKKEAFSFKEVQLITGAGTRCGKCQPEITKIIEKELTILKAVQLKLNLR